MTSSCDVEILSGSVPGSVPDLISITNSDHVGCLNCYIDLVDLGAGVRQKNTIYRFGTAWALTYSMLYRYYRHSAPITSHSGAFLMYAQPKKYGMMPLKSNKAKLRKNTRSHARCVLGLDANVCCLIRNKICKISLNGKSNFKTK